MAGLDQEGKDHTLITTHLSLGCSEWWETWAVSVVEAASLHRVEMQEGRVLTQGSYLACLSSFSLSRSLCFLSRQSVAADTTAWRGYFPFYTTPIFKQALSPTATSGRQAQDGPCLLHLPDRFVPDAHHNCSRDCPSILVEGMHIHPSHWAWKGILRVAESPPLDK